MTSTVVVVAGDGAGDVVAALDGLHNVRAIPRGERQPAEVMELAARSAATYVVHDADPLAEVAAAWTGFFDGTGVIGGLEVAAGRWWPADLEAWLRGHPRVVPDRAGLPSGGVVVA
ncbi:hypothetical protein ACTWPT_34490 [Nonomuraea sp. 3N208]|uniref:hypothetical protein n=1 Tax=Nonomuraea sp. 3N208 TaxID=3457421 RepID=UPI003FD67A14